MKLILKIFITVEQRSEWYFIVFLSSQCAKLIMNHLWCKCHTFSALQEVFERVKKEKMRVEMGLEREREKESAV